MRVGQLALAAPAAREGVRVISLYFVIVYCFPLVGNHWLGDSVYSSYEIYPLSARAVAYLIGTYLLFRAFVLLRPHYSPGFMKPLLLKAVLSARDHYRQARMLIGLLGLPLAIGGLAAGLTSYRYAYEGISERGAAELPVMMILYVIASADMFYFMFVRDPAKPQGLRRRLEHLLFAAILTVAANGIATLLQAMFTVAYAASPRLFHSVSFIPNSAHLWARISRAIVAFTVFTAIFIAAWLGGTVIKLSSNSPVPDLLNDEMRIVSVAYSHDSLASSLVHYAVERSSIYYYSFVFAESMPRDFLTRGEASGLVYPFRTLLFRLDLVLGSPFKLVKPEIGSIMQLNYQLLTRETVIDRGGSAPGLLAAFTYAIPFFPLNLAASAIYLWWLAFVLATLFRRPGERMSMVGLLMALHFVSGVFSSPFDWLLVIDNDVFYMFLLYLLVTVKRTESAPSTAAVPRRGATGDWRSSDRATPRRSAMPGALISHLRPQRHDFIPR